MENRTQSAKSSSAPSYQEDTNNDLKKISSPLDTSSHICNILLGEDEEMKDLNHTQKLELLKKQVPKPKNNFKFWPIFDTKAFRQFSLISYHYFELYKFLLKLMGILMTLTAIFYGIQWILKVDITYLGNFWIFFGFGMITLVIIRVYSLIEEKRVFKQPELQAEDWTENKFALLVEHLPLNVTKPELRFFFEDKLREKGLNEKVREIMLLQECSRYKIVEKELRKKSYKTKKSIENKQSLIDNISKLQEEYLYILNSIEDFNLYKGIAIVIFETIKGKITIEESFRLSLVQRILYMLAPRCLGKAYRLHGQLLKIKSAPEPSDIIFENIHIPKSTRLWKSLLAYLIGNLALLIGIGIIVMVRLGHTENGLEPAQNFNFSFYIYSIIIIATTLIIYLITDFLVDKIIVNRKKSACELIKIKFRLNISYLNINAYLIILMHFEPKFSAFEYQVLLTAVILVILIPLRKIFSVIEIRKLWLRRKLSQNPRRLEKYSKQEVKDLFTKPQYDFANNIEDLICLMFLTLGFYFIHKLYIIGITLVGLMMSLCLDKLLMVRFVSPTRIKGSEMGLEFFNILRWDIRLQLLTMAFLPNQAFSDSIPTSMEITLYVLYGVFLVWDFRLSFRKEWKKKWSREREKTAYVDVQNYFQHTYKEEYPFKTY